MNIEVNMTAQNWSTIDRILCIRLDSLGDMVMTTPALKAIRETLPHCHLALMTSSAGATIAPQIAAVDELLVYDAPWMKATAPRSSSQPEHEMGDQLRDRQFDAAVIFTVYSQSPLPAALMCYLADIPLRLAHCRENPYQLLTDYIPDPEPALTRHEVQRQLDLVAQVGYRTDDPRLAIEVPVNARSQIARWLSDRGWPPSQPWIVMHPGATAASRRYPPEHFAEVARSLVQAGIAVVFTGTEPERSLVESIQSQMQLPSQSLSQSLVGQLSLPEFTALLAAAPLLVSNNTGPVHLAAAVGTPVVDLYALTNPQHTPWGVPHRVLFHDVPCRFCYKSLCPEGHHHCLQLLSPEQVVAATLELLAETEGKSQVVLPAPVLV